MISLTSAELNAWIVAFIFPLARILALLVAAPPFNNPELPMRVSLLLGLAIAMAIAPVLPAMPSAPAAAMPSKSGSNSEPICSASAGITAAR